MPKRQITLTCEVDETLARQLEETNLLNDPEALAQALMQYHQSKEHVLAGCIGALQAETAQYLTPMDGYLGLMGIEKLSDNQKHYLQTVQRNNHQLKLSLSRFALAFKIYYGGFGIAPCDHEDINFAEIVSAAWKTLQCWHSCSEVQVSLYIEQPNAPIQGVTHLLYEALLQLGEMIYRWEPQRIEIDLEIDAHQLNLILQTDALINFCEADFADFPTFSTFEVYNTYHILKAHQGDLKIRTQANTQFQITLPLARPKE